jgi:glutamate racemase
LDGDDFLNKKDKPIGFFDSGVGGISVLKEAIKLLPNEDFVYFGDSKNAPYGTKKVEEVIDLSFNAVDFLLTHEVKAVVVACNTATSAAIEPLRQRYIGIPIIGIEPALKPAVELNKQGKIIIMATPMTLSENKFYSLMKTYEKEIDIEALPCAGLVELIEGGILDGEQIEEYLKNKLHPYLNTTIAAIVLGCTHYPFIRKPLMKIVNSKTTIIDGSMGTAKQLKSQLKENRLLCEKKQRGRVDIFNSLHKEQILELSYNLLKI